MPRRFTTSSPEQAAKFLKKSLMDMIPATGAALYQEANEIMGDSKEICPVDKSTLVNSAYVTRPKIVGSKDEMFVEMGYGGSAKDYAIPVHEKTKSGVNWTKKGSGPKFLERPVNASIRGFLASVGKKAMRNILLGLGMDVAVGEFSESPK